MSAIDKKLSTKPASGELSVLRLGDLGSRRGLSRALAYCRSRFKAFVRGVSGY
ncbi:MAG: hypothetical protein IIY07_03675 [Thermoguttaceae bacterium]|nr:hypothetical protein [Thermoguttaceae bacterium]